MKKFLLLLLACTFAFVAESEAQNAAYLRTNQQEPWGQGTNIAAMNAVFGSGNWQSVYFQTVNVSSLLNSITTLYIDGSDQGANALKNFLSNNLTALQNWVSAGGKLFMNAAPNQGSNINFGFGGFTLKYSSFSPTGTASVTTHKIFNGPYTPVGTTWSGNYFAHASILGSGGTTLITGSGGVILTEVAYGSGDLLLGGMTTTNFHSPQPQATNLRKNILAYIKNFTSKPPAQLSVNPKSMDFGTVKAGDSVTMCGTVKNAGTATLKFNTVAVSGSSYYSYASGPKAGDSLQPGVSKSFCVKYKPTNNGFFSGSLTFITNGRDSGTQTVGLGGFGTAPVLKIPITALFRRTHTRLGDTSIACFQLFSTGTGPVRVDSVRLMGINPDEYYIVYKPTVPIPSGTSDSVCIGFKPNFEGRSDARVVVYSNASNLPTDTVGLFGIGSMPRLVISPANISFDSVAIGDSVCKMVTLSNPGTDTLRIKRNYEASGDLDYIFTPVAHSDTVILPDHSILFNICFRPLQNGTRVARYRFRTDIPLTFEQSRRDTGLLEINVTGIGVPSGRLAIGGATLDSAIIGQQVCQTDTIYNRGSNDLTVTSASLSGADSSSFTATGVTFPLTIKAGSFAVINVCSTPARRNLNTTSLLVTSTTGGKTETVTVPLATKGLLVCASTTPPGLFTTSQTLVGAMDSSTFTVTNCGDVPAKYTVSLPSGTDYSIVPLTSATIAPGDTARFTVVFLPTAIGPRNSTATVTAPNGIPAMTVTLGGTGTGVTVTATGEGDSVNLGDCKTFDVTITNTGNTSWTPGKGTITGPNSTDFTIVSEATPATIAPNGTAIVTIKFCPKTTEGETANLTFDNAAPKPITPFQYTLTASGRNSEGVTAQTEQNGFRLEQNYPNPSQRTTDIQFSTPGTANVSLTLLDNQGKLIRTLLTGVVGQGSHTVKLNVSELPSGNYLYILQTPQARLVRQMAIVK